VRVPAAAVLAGLALASSAGAVDGDWATASASGSTIALRLHFLMTCGQPGEGPLVVRFPRGVAVTNVRATVRGVQRLVIVNGRALSIDLPKPPQLTCMSIGEGTLPVTISSVHAQPGSYIVSAQIRNHVFTARLRIG
jgi:hypothetical protein